MMVKCPNCGHSGKLPPGMETTQHKIRCRRCGVRFETQAGAAQQNLATEPQIEPDKFSELATGLGIGPESKSEEHSLIAVGDLRLDDSDDQLQAVSERGPTISPEPWFYRFLDGWGLCYLYAGSLTFVALLIAIVVVIGVWSNSTAKDVNGFSISLAIAGFAVAALLGSFLFTSAAVMFLIVDQARIIRRLEFRTEQFGKS